MDTTTDIASVETNKFIERYYSTSTQLKRIKVIEGDCVK